MASAARRVDGRRSGPGRQSSVTSFAWSSSGQVDVGDVALVAGDAADAADAVAGERADALAEASLDVRPRHRRGRLRGRDDRVA